MIIFCDTNKELVSEIETIKTENKWNFDFIVEEGDIFECQKKYSSSKIATASNPDFTFGGGLDLEIASKYPEEIKEPKEFSYTDNLFFTITVDKNLKATKDIIKRALIGCFAYGFRCNIIISGFGTGIGGMIINDFIFILGNVLKKNLLNANLRYANLLGADLRAANLRDADLLNANLRDANLSAADLRAANLRYADLGGSDLRRANLSAADLRDSDLRGSDLGGSDLGRANLRRANLRRANLIGSDLRDSDLGSANLRYANLRRANLIGSDLQDSDLGSANLLDTDIGGVKSNNTTCFFSLQCPSEGSFIAWKKSNESHIIKLLIPETAKRSSATSRKCRASEAIVLNIYDGEKEIEKAQSNYNKDFYYKKGDHIKIDNFDEDRWEECGTGIHFFITREEAEQYCF